MSFANLGLPAHLLTTLTALGYRSPTTIQSRAIQPILAGRDLIAAAPTGTGKTAGYALPLLARLHSGAPVRANHIRALVLAPTRELASQIGDSFHSYGTGLRLRVAVVYGGVKINPQMMALRRGVDVLIATPGRLLDLYRHNAVRFGQLDMLVLDEADRMLAMGFADDIGEILALLPAKRQSLLFSATFSPPVTTLARRLLRNPVEISDGVRNTPARSVKHWLCPVDKKRKGDLLRQLLRKKSWQRVLVFTKTRAGAERLARQLSADHYPTDVIHGERSQAARNAALAAFKQGTIKILVATDIAARGLDIDQLPVVVNFDLPKVAEDYIHRVGRTGRAGDRGEAVSLVSADEFPQLSAIEQLLGQTLPRHLIDDFEPDHDVPQSRLLHQPRKNKVHKPGKGRKLAKLAKSGSSAPQLAKGSAAGSGKKTRSQANANSRPSQKNKSSATVGSKPRTRSGPRR